MGGQRQPRPLYPRCQLYRRLGEPPGPVWTDAKNLEPTEIRSPLYRLSNPGPQMVHVIPPHSHRWHLSICPTVTPRLVPRRQIYQSQLLAAIRLQLPSHQRLFEITYEADVSWRVQRDGGFWERHRDWNLPAAAAWPLKIRVRSMGPLIRTWP